uniref:Activating transcription factor 7 interacting protein n=1 Tax=Myripristis murdjan TaxID=586833 RepID=A0A668AQ20_9TELE
MEVVVAEEKKKIFRARKTMKISDRQQLETLHNTLLTGPPSLSNPSPPPLLNGTHKDDGQKVADKEQNNTLDSNSPRAASPVSPASRGSPIPSLSLNLSPSPSSSQSPKPKDETPTSPISPFHSLNFELKKMEEEGKKGSSPSPSNESPSAPSDQKLDQEIKAEEDIKEEVEDDKEDVKKGSVEKQVEKMEVDSVKVETKKVKMEAGESAKPSRPSSTPPSQEAKCSTSGLKRTLSEGYEKDEHMERDVKRPKVDGVELEAQLELKITAKASSRLKLEKVVQQLVEERLNLLQLTEFDKNLQELKERVEKIDSATKHQTTLNTLQAKIARLAKKFGEANQMSENKRKQEPFTFPIPLFFPSILAPSAQPTPAPTSTSTAMVPQAPILQLITSTSNAASTLATGITTQSPTGTLLLKTAPGSGMVATGQPLLIQLPLSMTNGQTGTLVNIPVSSLSAANSLNKPAAATTTAAISLARAVYQGGAGGISTPNAGVSVTTARTPAQSVSVAGAMSSASSPATSGPAATGSAAPGPPQGTSMTSKTDNQATSSASSTKTAAPGARPKGSVIDLTEDDDDVQVTGVKNATVSAPPTSQRPLPVVSIPNSKSRSVTTTTSTRASTMALPPLPSAPPPPGRLPPEAAQTSLPQQPQLKLVPSQTGIVLSWCVAETDRTCAAVDSYHLYAFHQDNSNNNAAQQHWKKIGEVKALPLPMACTLTQFQSGSTYHFAVRAKDIYGRFGSFCEPQCTNVISSNSS